MARYSVVFTRSARKELEALEQSLAFRIFARIERLVEDPRPRGVRKLRGASALWRLRVGEYRVIYSLDDRERLVDIRAIRHRSDAYA